MYLTLIKTMLLAGVWCFISTSALAQQQVIKAGVAPDLNDGMYTTLINYVGEQLNIEVDIVEVPLQRRLLMLEEGELDLAVGLFMTAQRSVQFTYIEPEYTTKTEAERLYLLESNFDLFKAGTSIRGHSIAILRNSNLYKSFSSIEEKQLFETSSLLQSIDLLLKKRVDYFIYTKDATDKKLLSLGIKHRVVESELQPSRPSSKKVYLAISRHSFLANKTAELSKITTALKQGEYDRLYKQLYQVKAAR